MPEDPPKTLPPDFFGWSPEKQNQFIQTRPHDPPKTLPSDFFDWSPEKQNQFVRTQQGRSLSDFADLPGAMGRFGVENLPAIAATGGVLATAPVSLPAAVATAALYGGLGKLAQMGIRSATGQGTPGSLGEAADLISGSAIEQGEQELGGQILSRTLGRVFRPYLTSKRLYQSALKPSGTSEEKALKAIGAGLEERIPLNEFASEMVGKRIQKLNGEVENTILQAPANIPPAQYVSNIGQRMDKLRTKWAKDATYGQLFVENIDEMERQFLIQHANVQPIQQVVYNPALGNTPALQRQVVTIYPKDMTLAELRMRAQPLAAADAQAIKQQTYRTIRASKQTAWDPGTHPTVALETRKEIAKALRLELEQIYPQIKGLNMREGALIALDSQIDRWLKREWNKQITPYFIFPIAGGMLGAYGGGATHGLLGGVAGTGAGGSIGAVAAHMLRSVLEDPAIKSRVAIALDRAARIPGAALGRAVAKELPSIGVRVGTGYLQNREEEARKQKRQLTNPSVPASAPPAALPAAAMRQSSGEAGKSPRTSTNLRPATASLPGWKPEYQQELAKASAETRAPLQALRAIGTAEGSGGDPRRTSPKGAVGPMQLTPDTARALGVDPYDWKQNIHGGAWHFNRLLNKPEYKGRPELAVAAYNAGEGAVAKYHNQIPPFPETQDYVNYVMTLWKGPNWRKRPAA